MNLGIHADSHIFIHCSNSEITNKENVRQKLMYELYDQILSDTTDVYLHSFCLMEVPMEMLHLFNADFPQELDLIMHILNEEEPVNILNNLSKGKILKKCIENQIHKHII